MGKDITEKKFGVGRYGRYLEVPWASSELNGTLTESSVHIRTLHFGFHVVHSMVIWVVTQKPWFNFFAGKHARLGSPGITGSKVTGLGEFPFPNAAADPADPADPRRDQLLARRIF